MSRQDIFQRFDFELRPFEMNGGLRFPATGRINDARLAPCDYAIYDWQTQKERKFGAENRGRAA